MMGNSTMVKDHMKCKMRPQADVEASDSLASLMLTTVLLTVDNSAASVTPDLSMLELIHDSILAQLNAPGGQNDPQQDEDFARSALHTPEPANTNPEPVPMLNSPLTDLPSQANDMQLDEVAYAIPHCPASGPSTHPTHIPAQTLLPLMGALHTRSLTKNCNGSSNAKGKAKGHGGCPTT